MLDDTISIKNAKKAWELKKQGLKLQEIAEKTELPAPYLSFLFRVTDSCFYDNDITKKIILIEELIKKCQKLHDIKKSAHNMHKQINALENSIKDILNELKNPEHKDEQ